MFDAIIGPLIKCIVALFVIMDPIASLPMFLILTRKQNLHQRQASAVLAAGVAGGALMIFVIAGPAVMSAMSISMPAFQIAGGILLLVMSVQYFLGIEIENAAIKDLNVAAVVVGVPLLTGPGAMTTAVILASQYGLGVVFVSATVVVLLIWAILSMAETINKYIGRFGIEVFSKIMAILLAAVAVEFIKVGVQKIGIEWNLIHL
jgi:multiple antibiotic resistance protein